MSDREKEEQLRINQNPIVQRLVRLEREMIFWRVVAVAAAMFFSLAFAQEKAQREIRLTSADGRQVVVLSPQGIQLSDRGKKLGEIGFVTVGGDEMFRRDHQAKRQVLATRMFVQEEKNRPGAESRQRSIRGKLFGARDAHAGWCHAPGSRRSFENLADDAAARRRGAGFRRKWNVILRWGRL